MYEKYLKQMHEIRDKNISDEKYEKLRNDLFKMKELNGVVLENGLSPQYKDKFVWQKVTWVIKKGTGRSKTPFIGICFWLLIQIKKKFFSNRTFF